MKLNRKWLGQWDINLHDFPHTEEIKMWVLEKFRTPMSTKKVGKMKTYYVKEFSPMWKHDDKEHLSSTIKVISKILIGLDLMT